MKNWGENVKCTWDVFKPAFVDKESKRKRNRDEVTHRVVEIRFELRNLNSVDLELAASGEKYIPSPHILCITRGN